MATESFSILHTSSVNVYAAVWDSTGKVFDSTSNTFKTLGAATTPTTAATEVVNMGGSAKSGYIVDLNVALYHIGTEVKAFTIVFYERVGGSPNISADTYITHTGIEVASSVIASRLHSATAVWDAAKTITLQANPTPNTVEEALLCAILECRGKQSRSGTSFVKFRLDGSTIHALLVLDDADNPSARTPQSV